MDFITDLALMALGFLLLLFLTGAISRREWLAAWEVIKLNRNKWDAA